MSDTKSDKEIGWIETFYGDYWGKRKKLIIAMFFIPLVFSFFLLLELNCIMALVLNSTYDFHIFHQSIGEMIGVPTIQIIFIVSLVFFLMFSAEGSISLNLFEKPLKSIYEEIYVQKKSDPYMILVKNFVLLSMRLSRRLFRFFLFLVGFAIILIPSIIVGFLNYVHLDLFLVPDFGTFLTLIPAIGEPLKNIILFVVEHIGTSVGLAFQNIPLLFHFLLLFIPLMLLASVADLIEASVSKRQRGNAKKILKNGLKLITMNLNFPCKVARFFYVTFLCLFTDQRNIGLNIPVINSRNIQTAMQNVLGESQSYVARIPLDAEQIISEVEKFPSSVRGEIEDAVKEFQKTLVYKIIKTGMQRPSTRARLLKQQESIKQISVFLCVNAEGVMTYALVREPPPTYMTRVIEMLWCSDPTVKSKIIEELKKIE